MRLFPMIMANLFTPVHMQSSVFWLLWLLLTAIIHIIQCTNDGQALPDFWKHWDCLHFNVFSINVLHYIHVNMKFLQQPKIHMQFDQSETDLIKVFTWMFIVIKIATYFTMINAAMIMSLISSIWSKICVYMRFNRNIIIALQESACTKIIGSFQKYR